MIRNLLKKNNINRKELQIFLNRTAPTIRSWIKKEDVALECAAVVLAYKKKGIDLKRSIE